MDISSLSDHDNHLIRMFKTAMDTGLRLVVQYHNDEASRVTEPHAIGFSLAGNLVARVYQVRGHSNDIDTEGWKMLDLSKVELVWLLSEKSEIPRPGYKVGDKGMSRILQEL